MANQASDSVRHDSGCTTGRDQPGTWLPTTASESGELARPTLSCRLTNSAGIPDSNRCNALFGASGCNMSTFRITQNGTMTNIATVLKSEIARLARKEVRAEVEALKKASSAQRTEIVALKKRVQTLETALKKQAKIHARGVVGSLSKTAADEIKAPRTGLRFSAKGLASNRKRLGLSAAEFGALVGTTEQSIYAWESGRAQPRAKFLAAIAGLRGIGKRELAQRLAGLKSRG